MRHCSRTIRTLALAGGVVLLVAGSLGCASTSPRQDFFSVRAATLQPTQGSGRIARFDRPAPRPSAFTSSDLASNAR